VPSRIGPRESAAILRGESLASRVTPLPHDDRLWVHRSVGRLGSDWLLGSLRGLNLLLRLTQGLRPGLIYVAPSGLGWSMFVGKSGPSGSLSC